jgi:Melibiase
MNRLVYLLVLLLVFATVVGCERTDDSPGYDSGATGPEDDDDDATDDDDSLPPVMTFSNGRVDLTVDRRSGTFDVAIDGYTYIRRATSAIETGAGNLLWPDHEVQIPNEEMTELLQVEEIAGVEGTVVRLFYPLTEQGRITTDLTLMKDGGGLLASMTLTAQNLPDLASLIPIYVGPETGGGLFMKSDPDGIQVLQNGSEIAFDFYTDLLYADYPYTRGILNQYVDDLPSSASNWNALYYDRANDEGLNAGYLSFESVIPEVILGYDEALNPTAAGGEGFFTFQVRNGFIIPRYERPGAKRTSELFWLDRFDGRPQASLEAYARMVADRLDIKLPHDPVASWDSWYIYGDELTEALVDQNLEDMVEAFGEYGMTSLQVDLGWYDVWGDWGTDNRFPNGIEPVAQRIKDAGLIPELWVSPFNAARNSQVIQQHPDWQAQYIPIAAILMQLGVVPIDLSIDEAADWVADTGTQFAEMGIEAVKFDFAYYEIMLTALANPSMTAVEAYRRALAGFRDKLGPEKFFINILLGGINYGLCDSMRIGIDSWPCWGDTENEWCPWSRNTSGREGFGLRIMLKGLARRYYLNNTIWVNHPDQIFFRDYLGLIPQRSWATVVALSGAVMSLGEQIDTMTAEEIDTYRRLLPNLGVTGVPWDLFDREYPEVWLTPLNDREPGGYVLGLYSWGNNFDRIVNPPVEIAEGTRFHEIALSDLELEGPFHAFEFWTQTDLGIVTEVVEMEVPARDSRVVILRPVQDRPYIVASNRHVSQGGTDLHNPAWNEGQGTLAWEQDLIEGFEHRVYIDPAGKSVTPTASATNGATATVSVFGDLWAVDIEPASTGSVTVSVTF